MKQRSINMAKQADNQDNQAEPVDSELQNIIEAALYASKIPLGIKQIMSLFPDDAQPSKVDIQNVILSLQELCEHRGIELRRIGKGWRFQSKEKYSPWLRKLVGNKPPRYSRALLETLSIIAYRQPVTRGDIEEVRGVGVSSDTIRTLEERDWVTQIGHRDVPGRPALFGTTQGFLEYFNMTSLRELPELMEKRELGEIAKDMNLTLPMDGVQGVDEAAVHQEAQAQKSESAEVIALHPEEAGIEEPSASEIEEPSASEIEEPSASGIEEPSASGIEEPSGEGADSEDASKLDDSPSSNHE
ncbi:MAG: segregation and condensation protein B [Cryomorphaceae bacterium]|jgi:segregation and condensation protein B